MSDPAKSRSPLTVVPETAPPPQPRPPAGPARPRRRHAGILTSFLALVAAPVLLAAWYLHEVALDRYASRVAFSVRTEEAPQSLALLEGLGSLSRSSTSDTDVLHDFILSQPMVAAVDARVDLRAAFTRSEDPVFALPTGATIEDLTRYWKRVVKVDYDPGEGLIAVRVLAFAPDVAHRIAVVLLEESDRLVNRLSGIARADATRHAQADLALAETRLVRARQALTAFRAERQIVDPRADIERRLTLIAALETQRTEAEIERDILRATTREGDQRIAQADRRIAALGQRISDERALFRSRPSAGAGASTYATLVADYERLSVEVEFAERAYVSALAANDLAAAEARRQARYLAAHIAPTRAESAEYPRRLGLLAMLAGATLLGWAALVLVYYGFRERR